MQPLPQQKQMALACQVPHHLSLPLLAQDKGGESKLVLHKMVNTR